MTVSYVRIAKKYIHVEPKMDMKDRPFLWARHQGTDGLQIYRLSRHRGGCEAGNEKLMIDVHEYTGW